MDTQKLIELENKVLPSLAVAATNTHENGLCLARFGAKVAGIHVDLKGKSLKDEETLSQHLRQLFDLLESLWMKEAKSVLNNNQMKKAETYPNLESFASSSMTQNDSSEILPNAVAAAICRQWKDVEEMLEIFQKALNDVSYSAPALPVIGKETDDLETGSNYREVIRTLYDTFLKHDPCSCTSAGDDLSNHWTRLLLKHKITINENLAVFHAAQPVPHTSNGIVSWRQLRVHVPRQSNNPKKKRTDSAFQRTAPDINLDEAGYRLQPIEDGQLCRLLRHDVGAVCIVLKVIDGRFHQRYGAELVQQRVAQSPSMPLSQALRDCSLSPRSKLSLAYVLARSIWQYYDSGFMKIPWTTDSIHFLRQLDDTGNSRTHVIDTSKPYFVFQRTMDNTRELADYCGLPSVVHRYPRILALGVFLVEICRGTVCGNLGTNDAPTTLEAQINNDYVTCMDAMKHDKWPDLNGLQNEETAGEYKKIVEKCLDVGLCQSSSEGIRDHCDIEASRAKLDEQVVRPLGELCLNLGFELGDSGKSGWIQYQERIEKSAEAAMLSRKTQPMSSKDWLHLLQCTEVQEPLDLPNRYRNRDDVKRIRIAVLDTGYDKDAVFFNIRPRPLRLIQWKDFVEDELDARDEDGHGTHVVSLAMQVAPAAEICVARVARDSEGLIGASSNIAKAIEWAAKTAEADIVTMSFGFSEEVEVSQRLVISNAISQALITRNQRILFFAAAANDGGNRAEMFPARHQSVFSIHATDHLGRFLPLNPAPDSVRSTVFGTLGDKVPGASRSVQSEPTSSQSAETCKDGTSAATPIAAGIAAMVLGYARLRMKEDAQREKEWGGLFGLRGMNIILTELSTQMEDKRRYLAPASKFVLRSDRDRDGLLQTTSWKERTGE